MSEYLKLYMLEPGQEFHIVDIGDEITIGEGEEEYTFFNKLRYEGMDGMYAKCLDLNLRLHFISGNTAVKPFYYD